MKSILIIDDKDDVRSFISLALTSFGFGIQQARDGDAALQMIVEFKPDLIICDVNMPGMNGFEILSAVRASALTATVPFIMMTGSVTTDGFRRAMTAGADDYLVKPFRPDDLVDSVMSHLARRTDFEVETKEPAYHRPEETNRHTIAAFAGAGLVAA